MEAYCPKHRVWMNTDYLKPTPTDKMVCPILNCMTVLESQNSLYVRSNELTPPSARDTQLETELL